MCVYMVVFGIYISRREISDYDVQIGHILFKSKFETQS